VATVKVPTPLRTYTQNRAEVTAPGDTVGEVLRQLDKSFPGLGGCLLDEKGGLRRYINVYFNDEDIRALQLLDTKVSDTDRLTIMPAIAGG
jgi:molybdopterin converting factor small subunit